MRAFILSSLIACAVFLPQMASADDSTPMCVIDVDHFRWNRNADAAVLESITAQMKERGYVFQSKKEMPLLSQGSMWYLTAFWSQGWMVQGTNVDSRAGVLASLTLISPDGKMQHEEIKDPSRPGNSPADLVNVYSELASRLPPCADTPL